MMKKINVPGFNGNIFLWDTQKLSIRDEAFMYHLNLKMGKTDGCEPFVKSAEFLFSDYVSIIDTAYWLWVTGNYISALEDKDKIAELTHELRNHISKAVELLEKKWFLPTTHWLGSPHKAVYLSNLSIIYGALLAIQPYSDPVIIQQILKNIRELVFQKFIKEGRIVSVLGSKSIHGDIVLAAVPFGMLGIEDRILIEALMKVEEVLVDKGVRLSEEDIYFGGCERFDLTALLAWYYAEKGEIHRAKKLVEHVSQHLLSNGELPELDLSTSKEEIYREIDLHNSLGSPPTSRLGLILLWTAKLMINNQGSAMGALQTNLFRIIHEPTGKDDPYVTLPYERYPRHPEENDRVFLRVLTEPFHVDQQVFVELSVNGSEFVESKMHLMHHPEGEKYWEFYAGRFRAGDLVIYRFRVLAQGEEIRSNEYFFQVREWHSLDHVVAYARLSEKSVLLELGTAKSTTRVCLEIKILDHRSISFNLKPGTLNESVGIPVDRSEEIVLIIGQEYMLHIKMQPFRLTWFKQDMIITQTYWLNGCPAIEVLKDAAGTIYKARLNMRLDQKERLYGMGERYSHIEFRGLEVDHYVYNQYRSQGLKTYIPVPFVISTQGYGLFLNTPMYSKFYFGTTISNLLMIEINISELQQYMEAVFFIGEPLEVISTFTALTGRPSLPPKWSFGPWMSSNNWDSQQEVEKQVGLTKFYKIPSTVIVLEQWSDEATFYIFNDAQYKAVPGEEFLRYDDFTFPEWGRWPNPKQMVENLHKEGLRVLLWQIPIQKYMYGVKHAQRDTDEKTMLEQKYHVRHRDGGDYRIPYNWFKDSLVLDFTNEDAKRWWFGKRAYLLEEVNIDGFKTDGGECIFGDDLLFANGSTGAEMRNLYPNLYIGAYHDEVQAKTGGNGITFSRAGYTGAQRYPLHWAGDERSTFQAFRSSVNAGLSCSMSGIPFWGWDLGGFHGDIPSAELFIRSAQMAAFCPVMQYHAETKGEFNQDRTPWNIAERTSHPEVIQIYKRYADLRMNLLPYIYHQAIVSCMEGIPLMRAMFLVYPHDVNCISMNGQYMFGDNLLVAPILEEGAYSKKVYFPEGSWISLFSEEKIEGPSVRTFLADLDEIPVFLKSDGVIALNLDNSCQLASHVGNHVDRYIQLCFLMYIVDRIDYRYQDDLSNEISLRAHREGDHLSVEAELHAEEKITLILKGLESVSGLEVAIDQNDPVKITKVSNPEGLGELGYCYTDNKLYIRLNQSSKLVIQL